MKYTLMHKEISVCDITIDSKNQISKINEMYNANHLPVGTGIWRNGQSNRATLNEWWIDRSIPTSRSGVRQALETLDISDTKMLLTKCFGLSLSDQYWIRPFDRPDIAWKDINFFDNDFSDDIGDVLLGKVVDKNNFDFSSPDNTSDGCLKKRWKIINGKRCLIKAGSAPLMLQPFNEVIATLIMSKLNIPHVPYWIVWDDGEPYSVCEDFIESDTEFISAWRIFQSEKRDSNTSVYRHYINCCESLGVTNITHAIDQMIVIDYIIANEDRHLNNFGLVRNANNLEYIGAAPIFDSGSSLGYSKLPGQILTDNKVTCKPFKTKHDEQLKLVSSFKWIDFSALENIEDDIRKVFDGAGPYADENRINAIITMVKRKITNVWLLANQQIDTIDNIEDDVLQNIAEDYLEI